MSKFETEGNDCFGANRLEFKVFARFEDDVKLSKSYVSQVDTRSMDTLSVTLNPMTEAEATLSHAVYI